MPALPCLVRMLRSRSPARGHWLNRAGLVPRHAGCTSATALELSLRRTPVRALRRALIAVVLPVTMFAQARDSVEHDKTFLTRRDFLVLGVGAAATGVLSIFDDDIAIASQQ